MRRRKSSSIFILAATLGLTGLHARASQTDCKENYADLGNFKVETRDLPSLGGCIVRFHPIAPRALSRSYILSGLGGFFVQNYSGGATWSKSSCARQFYVFPRIQSPSYQVLPSGNVALTTSAGETIFIDSKTGRVLPTVDETASAAQQKDSSIIQENGPLDCDPKNRDNLEFLYSKSLVLDLGFRIGEAPVLDRSRYSTFNDSQGHSCKIRNFEVFDYTDRYEPKVRFTTDADLAIFLAKRCPSLVLPWASNQTSLPVYGTSAFSPSSGEAGAATGDN